MDIKAKVLEFNNLVGSRLSGTAPRANAGKKLSVPVGQVVMIQYPNYDLIGIEMNEAPSVVPDDPEAVPYLVVAVAPGYGQDWLKKATSLKPDEIIEG